MEEDVDEVIMDLGPPVAAVEGEEKQQPDVKPDQHQPPKPVQDAEEPTDDSSTIDLGQQTQEQQVKVENDEHQICFYYT